MSNQHFKAAVLSTPSSVCILCKALKPFKQQYIVLVLILEASEVAVIAVEII